MMSEYVFGYLLMIEQHMLERWQAQQINHWDNKPAGRLKGKLIGLMGVGSIGAHLALTAKHFGMRVHGFTRQSESCGDVDRYFHPDSLFNFASDLDFLVCTLPSTPATKNIINKDFLAALPKKVWLVNTGRGSTLNESALIEALDKRTIAGIILDVFQEEPLPHDHSLWTTPNTFMTFHTAAKNCLPDIAAIFTNNYQRYLASESLLYQVDFEQGY